MRGAMRLHEGRARGCVHLRTTTRGMLGLMKHAIPPPSSHPQQAAAEKLAEADTESQQPQAAQQRRA